MPRTMAIPTATERYLNERRENVSDSTLYNHSSQLRQFINWCEEDDDRPKNVDEIDNWHVSDFKMDRREEIEDVTLYNQMSALRVFIQWCEKRDLLEGISEGIIMPDVEDDARDEKMEPEKGEGVLQDLRTYEYASAKHVSFALLWTTGIRAGTLRSLDVSDYHSDEMYLEIVHRPDSGTPLKNKTSAEREINLHEWVCVLLDDYIDGRRIEQTDDVGREPLLTTKHGRVHRNTIRKYIKAVTRPCEFSSDCPFDRTIEDCEATAYNKSAGCPGSVSPHPLRRSAITNLLNEGHSKELISDRVDVSTKVLDKHYDARTEGEKRELRREMFDM